MSDEKLIRGAGKGGGRRLCEPTPRTPIREDERSLQSEQFCECSRPQFAKEKSKA